MSSDRRALFFRIVSVGFFFLTVFLLASLVTYSVDDPPAGQSPEIKNLCGTVGAYVAHWLLSALGAAVYLLLAAGIAIVAAYVVKSAVPRRYLRIVLTVAGVLIVLMSLWSFDAATDPHRIDIQPVQYNNSCGFLGVQIGHYLLAYAGVGVWLGLLALAAAAGMMIAGHKVKDRLLRVAGVVILMASVSTLAHVLVAQEVVTIDVAQNLQEGKGGMLGNWMGGVLLGSFGPVGTYLALIFMSLAGLVLATDTLLLMLPLAIYNYIRERRMTRMEALKGAAGRLRLGLNAVVKGEEGQSGGRSKSRAKKSAAEKKAEARAQAKAEKQAAREAAKAAREAEKAAAKAAKAESAVAEENEAASAIAVEIPLRSSQSRKAAAAAEQSTDESEKAGAEAETAKRPVPKIRTRERSAGVDSSGQDGGGSSGRMRLVDSSEGPGDQAPAYSFPPLDILDPPEDFDISAEEESIRANARNLEATLQQFGVDARVVGIDTGPVITQYEVSLGAGIKVGKVVSLSDDLAIGLKAPSVRIVAPLPGRGTIGIEVPNQNRKTVRLRESIEDGMQLAGRSNIPLFLGKDSAGNSLVRDLTQMPHLLIGGTTGSGKSVCLNTIIMSILYTRSPRDVKMILVDPKMVEMTMFASIPHLMCPVVSDMSRVQSILEWLIGKMEERYAMLAEAGVKNIVGFNNLTHEQIVERFKPTSPEDEMRLTYHMPYIVLVIDELADLMMTAAKEAEAAITRLAQKSRAVGIHLILATQRPSVDVVTGLIKSNHPCRIAFQVASRVDSRTIIDSMGADKLLGKGDMLLMAPGVNRLMRGQCTFISEPEIINVVDYITKNVPGPEFNRELVQIRPKPPAAKGGRKGGGDSVGRSYGADGGDFSERDELFNEAVKIVLQHKRGSVSLLQRKMSIGYGRASRLIDFMAEAGLVGEYQGSNARETLVTLDEWEASRGEGIGAIAGVGDDDDYNGDELADDSYVEDEI